MNTFAAAGKAWLARLGFGIVADTASTLRPVEWDAPRIGDVCDFMAERDYVPYDMAGFIRRPFDGALALVDVCFARRIGVLRRDPASWHAATTPRA